MICLWTIFHDTLEDVFLFGCINLNAIAKYFLFFIIQKRSDNLLKFRDKELSILRQKQLQEEDLIAKSSPSNKESNWAIEVDLFISVHNKKLRQTIYYVSTDIPVQSKRQKQNRYYWKCCVCLTWPHKQIRRQLGTTNNVFILK